MRPSRDLRCDVVRREDRADERGDEAVRGAGVHARMRAGTHNHAGVGTHVHMHAGAPGGMRIETHAWKRGLIRSRMHGMRGGMHGGGRPRRAQSMTRDGEMWASEALVSEAIGRLIGFWGFNKHLGRIWTVLYLSDEPLSSRDLQGRLAMSSGAVSMALQEMGRWGIVNKVWLDGQRREYFVAERDFWKMISRVYRERERAEVLDAIDAMEEAIRFARRKAEGTKDEDERRRAKTQLERIGQLLDLARLGLRFIDMLLDKGRVDASPLLGLFLGESKKSD